MRSSGRIPSVVRVPLKVVTLILIVASATGCGGTNPGPYQISPPPALRIGAGDDGRRLAISALQEVR